MKNLLDEALAQLKASTGATRLVIAAGAMLILTVGLFSVWRGRNPHMIPFKSGLDNSQFSSVIGALGNAGIRFRTSTSDAPYTIFVDEEKLFEANIAVAQDSALLLGPRGINTDGNNGAFDAQIERSQKADKRIWQEIEQQLEAMDWIVAAKVIARTPRQAIAGRHNQTTVSVQLKTKELYPDPSRAQAAANLVKMAFATDAKNITIVDQFGNNLFDGNRDSSLDRVLEFERNADRELTMRAQDLLDKTFGLGMGIVKVRGEWTYEITESMDEALDPKKAVIRETLSESVTPGLVSAGGPAGVQENLTVAQPGSGNNEPATRSDTERQYGYGTKTTHRIQDQPQLLRLTASLILDQSKQAELEKASQLIRNAIGFNEARGDQFEEHSTALPGIERDEEGNPIPVEPPPLLEAPNHLVDLVLKHGIEGLAALVFLIVLVRSLKGGDKVLRESATLKRKQGNVAGGRSTASQSEAEEEEEIEIDPEVLARKQIEQLIDTDPERVSALLSRWAMSDTYYSESEA